MAIKVLRNVKGKREPQEDKNCLAWQEHIG